MGTLHSFHDLARRRARVSFNQEELRQLLDIYSQRVAAGEWRDYAIDHYDDRAVFSIFRHTADQPLYVVEKIRAGGSARTVYQLAAGPQRIQHGTSLAEIVSAIARRPRLILSAS